MLLAVGTLPADRAKTKQVKNIPAHPRPLPEGMWPTEDRWVTPLGVGWWEKRKDAPVCSRQDGGVFAAGGTKLELSGHAGSGR